MKLRIAEKIFKRHLDIEYKLYGNKLPLKFKKANNKEIKALKICKKFKGEEYWAFHINNDKTIHIRIGG